MRIGIQVWGSHGDIRPLWALAEGLQSAGHQVTLAITAVHGGGYDASMSDSGIRILDIASPVIPDAPAYGDIEETIRNTRDPLKQVECIIDRLFLPAESPMYAAAEQLCADNDLVIGHFFHYPLQTAAEKTGRPYVSVILVPSAIPSRFIPPAGFPAWGQLGNRAAWWLTRTLLNKHLKKYPDALRTGQDLPPAGDMATDVWASRQLSLVATSPQIVQRQPDWPAHYRICGFLDMPHLSTEGTISPELERFLAAGDAPVYMTFGSVMPSAIPAQRHMIELLIEAAGIAGCRAIIQAPSWQVCEFRSTDTVHFVQASPYSTVFPHCRAIVHHGGAGTTQSALKAGKPSVVVAHIAEQKYWGRQLERMGVAPPPLSANGLSARKLARGIETAVHSPRLSENACRAGAAMAEENGVNTAVGLIESLPL